MCCCHYGMWNDSQFCPSKMHKNHRYLHNSTTSTKYHWRYTTVYLLEVEEITCIQIITLTEWQTSVSQGLQKSKSPSGPENCVMVRGWGPYMQMQSPPFSPMQEYEFIGLPGLEDWEVLSMITLKHSKESQELNSVKASRCNLLIGSFLLAFFHSFIQRVIQLSFTKLNKTSPCAWEVC